MLPAFLVYLDDLKSFKGIISNDDFAAALWAISEYTETGEEVADLSPMATVLYRMIKAKVDREAEKYEKKCEAGAKGGRPKKEEKPTETNENQTKPNETNENQRNQKETETEKETEIYSTTTGSAGAREDTPFGPVDIDPLIIKVQRELLGLTDTHYDLLRQYRGTLGDELVSFAIDQAVGNGVRKWSYVESILCRYETDGIRTVAEAKAAEEKRRNQPKGRDAPKTVTAQRFQQREYTDAELDNEVSPLFAEALKKVSGT